jgi:hypothetical protein
VVGKLGLPMAAAAVGLALLSSGPWAVASGKPASTVSGKLSARSADSNVAVSIPSVVFGQSDGLPRTLTSGTYQAVFDVWLAAGSHAAVASVTTTAGHLSGCHALPLHPAAVTKLRCTLVLSHARSLTLTVRTSVAGQGFQRSYEHDAR